jgi:myo-inositol-1(or 4)-monophosphatase
MGSAALDLAYVASGRYDGYWERNLNSYDIAAGLVIVREAGGYVSDADGGTDMLTKGSVVCGNETAQRELLKLVRAAGRELKPASA